MSRPAPKAPARPPRVAPAGPGDMDAVRALFREYEKSLATDAAQCFADFEKELAGLPGDCAPPGGGILLARDDKGVAVGVVAFRRLEPGIAEIKRLYLKPASRGRGLGRQMMNAALRACAAAGSRAVRLSTVPDAMHAADALYRTMGFRPIPAYPGAACAAVCYETEL
ncbi:MAG: GNAT family N-acetyltransferase [Rhodospirillales bacterium]